MRQDISSKTALAARSIAPCHSPYELLTPIRVLRRNLGLTPNDLAVLTALISFMPRENWNSKARQGHLLTVVFPSNDALSSRTNGIDERTVRRSVSRLTEAGLVERKNSANGKRFPLRYGGIIRDAFGFDLRLLLTRHAELTEWAGRVRDQDERMRSLRAEALALRTAALRHPGICATKAAFLATARNVLRRSTITEETVVKVIRDLRRIVQDAPVGYGEQTETQTTQLEELPSADDQSTICLEAEHVSGTNGQNVRHIESTQIDIKPQTEVSSTLTAGRTYLPRSMSRDPGKMAWEDFQNVSTFFPEAPRSGSAMRDMLLSIGNLLRIRKEKVIRCLNSVNAGRILLAFDYLIANANSIAKPEAYFERMMAADIQGAAT